MMQNIHAHRGFAQISSKILFYSILILSSQRSIASEVSTIVGQQVATATFTESASEVFGHVSEALAPAWGVVSWIGVGVKVCYVGVDVTSYFFPNKEEQSRIADANKKLRVAIARSKFRNCLNNNRLNPKINASGRPVNCEELARIFVACGGGNEEADMTATFNKMKKGKS